MEKGIMGTKILSKAHEKYRDKMTLTAASELIYIVTQLFSPLVSVHSG